MNPGTCDLDDVTQRLAIKKVYPVVHTDRKPKSHVEMLSVLLVSFALLQSGCLSQEAAAEQQNGVLSKTNAISKLYTA